MCFGTITSKRMTRVTINEITWIKLYCQTVHSITRTQEMYLLDTVITVLIFGLVPPMILWAGHGNDRFNFCDGSSNNLMIYFQFRLQHSKYDSCYLIRKSLVAILLERVSHLFFNAACYYTYYIFACWAFWKLW